MNLQKIITTHSPVSPTLTLPYRSHSSHHPQLPVQEPQATDHATVLVEGDEVPQLSGQYIQARSATSHSHSYLRSSNLTEL